MAVRHYPELLGAVAAGHRRPVAARRRDGPARAGRRGARGDGRLRPHGRHRHHVVLSGAGHAGEAPSAGVPTGASGYEGRREGRALRPRCEILRACASSASATASADRRLSPRSRRGCTRTPSWATWCCCTRCTCCCSRTPGCRRPRSARCSRSGRSPASSSRYRAASGPTRSRGGSCSRSPRCSAARLRAVGGGALLRGVRGRVRAVGRAGSAAVGRARGARVRGAPARRGGGPLPAADGTGDGARDHRERRRDRPRRARLRPRRLRGGRRRERGSPASRPPAWARRCQSTRRGGRRPRTAARERPTEAVEAAPGRVRRRRSSATARASCADQDAARSRAPRPAVVAVWGSLDEFLLLAVEAGAAAKDVAAGAARLRRHGGGRPARRPGEPADRPGPRRPLRRRPRCLAAGAL